MKRRAFLHSLALMALGLALPRASAVSLVANRVGYVNVKWFGATGDGVANDTDAFQHAIDVAKRLNLPIYVPPGTYRNKYYP